MPETGTISRRWLTKKQVADALSVTTRTVDRYVAMGLLKRSTALPGRSRFRADLVDKLLQDGLGKRRR